jgi:hypothetical protein
MRTCCLCCCSRLLWLLELPRLVLVLMVVYGQDDYGVDADDFRVSLVYDILNLLLLLPIFIILHT